MKLLKTIIGLGVVVGVALGFAGIPAAFAVDAPGLKIEIPFQPDYIRFPDRYEEKVPALYQAHLALQKYPRLMTSLIREREEGEHEIVSDTTLNPIAKREKYDILVAGLDKKKAAVAGEEREMRRAFLLLARDYLMEEVDPYILFLAAQIYYPIRHESSEAIRRELEAAAQAAAAEETPAEEGTAAPELAPSGEAPAVEAAPAPRRAVRRATAGKNPSMAVIQEFDSNFERILAALEEIRQRFPDFEHMHAVVHYLAVLKAEAGKRDEMVALVRQFIKSYPQSPYYGEMLFRLGEWMFETPFAFDRYSQAVGVYERALKIYTEPSRERYQALYKRAWSMLNSPDLSAGALDAFVELYKEIQQQPRLTLEMQMMQMEAIEVIKRIRAVEHPANLDRGGSRFGR